MTARLGLLEGSPPQMVVEEKAPDVVRQLTSNQRDALIILLHWIYGAGGGAVFGALPERLRLKPWAGPVFGVLLWVGFEAAVVPILNLQYRHSQTLRQRAVLAADHLLYGVVLSELRRKPRQ